MAERKQIDVWQEERAARERGFLVVAGVDEAGRGPLAGPVVAAAAILPFGIELPGVRDSKVMTPQQREKAFALIDERAEAIGIGMAEPAEIDAINILRASQEAMRRAVGRLPMRPDVALIDGLRVNPFPVPQIALVRGDARSLSVSAASIIAKVTRDRMMVELEAVYPGYGFAVHKGYPTPEHLRALEDLGPCAIHRRSFAPVSALLDQPALPLARTDQDELGRSGETVACAHLRRIGWEVVTTRYRCREGEVDIVAREGATLAFVEVKARRGRAAEPIEAVNAGKRARIAAAMDAYLHETGVPADAPCRLDVLEVIFGSDGNARVNLIRSAFGVGD